MVRRFGVTVTSQQDLLRRSQPERNNGRESWVDVVDMFFTQCKYDSHKMKGNIWKKHCLAMTPYMFNDLVWTKYVGHLELT